jgi:hypothetical protein
MYFVWLERLRTMRKNRCNDRTAIEAMIQFLVLTGILFTNRCFAGDSDSVSQVYEPENLTAVTSSMHFMASAYGTMGTYSTDTRSRSASAYITLSDAWKDYYTLGFATLWLDRDDLGGKYYSQELVSGQASWSLGYRTKLFATYAYLHESEIASYSSPATFHFGGGGGSYWLSLTEQIGMSAIVSLSEGKSQSENLRGFFSFHIAEGIWATSTATYSKAKWTPSLFVFRQSVSVPLGNESYIVASADVGRHAFHFDDEFLLVYNQRVVQTGYYLLKGTIRVFNQFYIIPSFEYNGFDEFNVKYGSLGARMVF